MVQAVIVNTLFFFLFYFSTPYWTGSGMAELSSSGIWRATFRALSFSGTLVYRLVERVSKKLDTPSRTLTLTVNLITHIAVLWAFLHTYEAVTTFLFGSDIVEIGDIDRDTLWGKLTSALAFLRVLTHTSGSIVHKFLVTARALATYTILNILFFSFLFGYLQAKVRPLHLGSVFPPDSRDQSLGGKILSGIKDALDRVTIIQNFQTKQVFITYIPIMVVYTIFAQQLGTAHTLKELVLEVLESIQLVPIVASYTITNATCRCVNNTAGAAIKRLPPDLQAAVAALSDKGNAWVKTEDAKRKDWADENSTTSDSVDKNDNPVHEEDADDLGSNYFTAAFEDNLTIFPSSPPTLYSSKREAARHASSITHFIYRIDDPSVPYRNWFSHSVTVGRVRDYL